MPIKAGEYKKSIDRNSMQKRPRNTPVRSNSRRMAVRCLTTAAGLPFPNIVSNNPPMRHTGQIDPLFIPNDLKRAGVLKMRYDCQRMFQMTRRDTSLSCVGCVVLGRVPIRGFVFSEAVIHAAHFRERGRTSRGAARGWTPRGGGTAWCGGCARGCKPGFWEPVLGCGGGCGRRPGAEERPCERPGSPAGGGGRRGGGPARGRGEQCEAVPTLPARDGAQTRPAFANPWQQVRNWLERAVDTLTQCRRLAPRYEKRTPHFLAMIKSATGKLWLRA